MPLINGVVTNGMIEPQAPHPKVVAVWGIAMCIVKKIRASVAAEGLIIDHAADCIRAKYAAQGDFVRRIDFPIIYDVNGNVRVVTTDPVPTVHGKPYQSVRGWIIGIVRVTWCSVKAHYRREGEVRRKQALFWQCNISLFQKVVGTPASPTPTKQHQAYAKRAQALIDKAKAKRQGPKAKAKHKKIMAKLKKSKAK